MKIMKATHDVVKTEIESGSLGGKYCKDVTGNIYYIVGVTVTDEDFYWVGINHKRQICFLPCIGILEPVDTGSIDFSMLNYLIKHEPLTIANDVKRYISSIGRDALISKINVNGVLY